MVFYYDFWFNRKSCYINQVLPSACLSTGRKTSDSHCSGRSTLSIFSVLPDSFHLPCSCLPQPVVSRPGNGGYQIGPKLWDRAQESRQQRKMGKDISNPITDNQFMQCCSRKDRHQTVKQLLFDRLSS